MIKCRSPRSLVLGTINFLWFLVRSEYAGHAVKVLLINCSSGETPSAAPGLELPVRLRRHPGRQRAPARWRTRVGGFQRASSRSGT